MNKTWKIIIGNIKAAKVDKARCARECTGETAASFYDRFKNFDYTIEAKIIAKLVENHSEHFANEFYAKIKDYRELSEKQRWALAAAFNECEITLADVKKAISEAGYDIEEDFMFDNSMDD